MTEHHLKHNEIDITQLPTYKLGAKYCRTILKCGGVCIYIHQNIKFSNINLLKYYKEQDLEIAAVKLKFNKENIIVACIYRAPLGEFDYFLNQLGILLNSLHNSKMEFILCGDFSINYTGNNNKKTQLDNLLNMYNLIDMVNFPTRITDTSFSTIHNIFVNKRSNYSINPYINGLSDHNAHVLTLIASLIIS